MYLVGVDGGGSKTHSALATADGEILETFTGGASSPRNEGVSVAVETVVSTILHYQKKIDAICIGLPAVAEEYGDSINDIEVVIRERIGDFIDGKTKIIVVSDQQVAFRSGSDSKNGVVAIAGTGSVVRGWNNGNDIKSGGWGWLTDSSGAFYIGKEAWRITVEAMDGRRDKTQLTKEVMRFFNTDNINDVNKILYNKNQTHQLAILSVIVDECAEQGDLLARQIINDSVTDLVNSFKNTVKRLSFEESFPLVLVGSMFKSSLFMSSFRSGVKECSSLANIIIPDALPVKGAVLIAKNIMEND